MIVGRVAELAQLRTLAEQVADGQGGVVWVEGEPGIGKSALLETGLADVAHHGCQLLWGTADELGQRLPLRAILDALGVHARARDPRRAAIAQYLSTPTGAPVAGFGSFDLIPASIERLLALVDQLCAEGPVVLVMDDLQWADEASLVVWDRLGLASRQIPLLLIGACRPIPRRAELLALRRRLGELNAVVLPLGPLTLDEATELAGQLTGSDPRPGLRRQLARAAGNPLYIVELVNALVREFGPDIVADLPDDRIPASLTEAIAARFDFLSDSTTEALRAASLLGMEFGVADLALVSGQPARALVPVVDEAIRAGVIEERGLRLRFRHPLFRHTLYSRMPASLREALHRQTAQALAEANLPIERIAQQLLLVSEADDSWSLDWLAETAQKLTYRAPTVAFELIGRYVKHLPANDPRREILDTELATAAFLLARYDDVLRIVNQLLTRITDPDLACEAAWLLGYALLRLGRFDEGTATMDNIIEQYALVGASVPRLRALQAMGLILVSRYEDATRIVDDILSQPAETIDRVAAGYALHARSLILYRPGRERMQVIATIDQALETIGEDPRAADLRVLLLTNRNCALLDLDRIDEADATLRQGRILAERAGTARIDSVRVHSGACHFQSGQWHDALADLESIGGHFDTRFDAMVGSGIVALIAGHRDDQTTARRILSDYADAELYAPGIRTNAIYMIMARSLLAERDGDPRQALADLLGLLDEQCAAGMDHRYLAFPELVRLSIAVDDSTTLKAAAAAADAEAARSRTKHCEAVAMQCAGVAHADPAPVLTAIESYFRHVRRPFDLARALEDAGVLVAPDDAQQAQRCLTEAVELYAELGASWDIRRADARMRAHGIRRGTRGPRRRPTTGWDALTPTERTVAELVAQGRSNPDIAAQLFLSRSTVQTHVSHILAKLGRRSRGEVASLALQRQRTEAPDEPAAT